MAIEAGDALVLEARPDALDEFRSALSLDFTEAGHEDLLRADSAGLTLIEAVVPEGARIEGRSAKMIGLGWRRRTVLMGIARRGLSITKQVRGTEIQAGDILLLLAPSETADDVIDWLGVMPLADRGLAVTANEKVWLAIGIFAAAVAAAAFGLLYLPVALGLVVVAFVLAKIVPIKEVYTHIEWSVVVLLGSMIPLGAALQTSGGTELIAGWLTTLTDGMPRLGRPDRVDGGHDDPVRCAQQHRHHNWSRHQSAFRWLRPLGVDPDPFLMGCRGCSILRVPHAHRAQEQHADPRARRL